MAGHDWSEAELSAAYARAVRAGRRVMAEEPRAVAAWLEPAGRRLVVELASGAALLVPVELVEGLAGATGEALAAVEVTPGGEGLHWEALDADVSVPGLLMGLFGSRAWMRALGRKGGAARSPAKVAAARANGRRGGRPRRQAG